MSVPTKTAERIRAVMKILAVAAIACLGVAAAAVAAEPTDCAAFTRSIDNSQRQLSKLLAEARSGGRGDVNARIQHELTLLQINTSILLRSNCPVPTRPVTADAYSKAASACEYAALRRTGPAAPLDECDTSKWQAD